MPGAGDAESCNSCPTLPLPMHYLTAQHGTGAWMHSACNEPLFAFGDRPLVFLAALEVSAVVRSEPGGCGAQERPLGCCALSPGEVFWALQGASAAGLQMQGGCCVTRDVRAAPARVCSILAACNAPLWTKTFPKSTVFLIRSFCKDLKPRRVKLHFDSWRSFSRLLITFRSCLGKGASPMAVCWGCRGGTAEAGWCSQQLLCKQKLLQPLSKGFAVPALKQERQ